MFLALVGAAGSALAEPLRIATTRSASAAPLLLAIEQNFVADQGLEPKLGFEPNDEAVMAAVRSGKADIGTSSLSAAFYRFAAAHDLKIIAARSSDETRFPIDVLLIGAKAYQAGFTGLKGIVGARLGIVGDDPVGRYALFDVAARFKLDASAIKTVPLKTPADAVSALSRGTIDAALLSLSDALRLVQKGDAILRLSDYAQWQEGVLFASATTIAARRAALARFIHAYQRATAEYEQNFLSYDDGGDFIPGPHHDEELSRLASDLRLAPGTLEATKTYCDPGAAPDVADIARQIAFWKDQGRLGKTVTAADLLDLSFLAAK
ncbi:MAG TPA: ABC transporter substrate-binding protein [Stellaceae bacterium]|nr:ABC transporter substrate-binding protein [Stellaceae bacterium]